MDHEELLIKDYEMWELYLHKEQYPYIGRCYAWAKDPESDFLTKMSQLERGELFETVIPSWDEAISYLYEYHRPNLAIFGNTSPHLHVHLIPRYNSPKIFHEIEFIDPNPR